MSETFDAQSTADEVLAGVDLSGKRILITGVSAGLGLETARALVARGAQVVGAVRDSIKAENAAHVIRDDVDHGGGLELVELDLASLASVRSCADALLASGRPFDAVIANAGVMACPFTKTVDGFETQFGVNHLGHFVFVNRLMPLLKSGARIVVLASAAHRFADVNLDDPGFEKSAYVEFVAYGRSKTANVLFAVELDRRHRASGIRATAVHPGAIPTELGRYRGSDVRNEANDEANASLIAKRSGPMSYKTIPQGAATTVWAAIRADAQIVGGRYCEDCHVADVVEDGSPSAGVYDYAVDLENAQALWRKSEKMVGERF